MPDDKPTPPANRELAARIVAAYVRRNQVGFDQIPALISTVHQALVGLGKPGPKDAGPSQTPTRSRARAREAGYTCNLRGPAILMVNCRGLQQGARLGCDLSRP